MDKIAKAIGIIENEQLTATVNYNEPLKNHTTLRIGGKVRAMYFPENAKSLMRICGILYEHGITPRAMGNGSNILAADTDLDLVVINTLRLKNVTLTDTVIVAEGGTLLSELAVFAQKHSLSGLEFAHGIPGTLGGAVVINAGAYGGEMKDVIHSTDTYCPHKGLYTATDNEHDFSYRHSIFSQNNHGHSDDIILSSEISLRQGDMDDIKKKMDELSVRRRESQPLDKPSAGSIFLRPKGGYAAQLIEEAGLKGFAVGGAQVSEKHAGFIINKDKATFNDVMTLIEHIQRTVRERSGIVLEVEVKIWKP